MSVLIIPALGDLRDQSAGAIQNVVDQRKNFSWIRAWANLATRQ